MEQAHSPLAAPFPVSTPTGQLRTAALRHQICDR
jgi:hypothetical protein